MFPVINRESVLSGFQWFFFIFCNTVVVPPTLLSAFHLPADNLLMLTQYAFLTTALACLVQAFCGHRRIADSGLAEGMRRTRQRSAAVRHRNRHRNGTRSSVPLATNRRARRCRHHGSGFSSRSHSVGRGTDSTNPLFNSSISPPVTGSGGGD
ncbi:purine permease ybbY [Salmonella enterica subsp. enterica]|nr:purine permease ybbY [Salmonella enterica subsp. enterica] [Salmonella enterica subsp. enterica serovar Singapore]